MMFRALVLAVAVLLNMAMLPSVSEAAHLIVPQNVQFAYEGTQGTWTWNAVPGADRYLVRLHKQGTPLDPCSSNLTCATIFTNSYQFTAEPDAIYDYWVQASDGTEITNVASGTTSIPSGPAPRIATITWSANSEADLAGYRVYRAIPCTAALVQVADVPSSQLSVQNSIPTDAQVEIAYAASAYDTSSNESQPSARVCKSLVEADLTAPASPSGVTVEIE